MASELRIELNREALKAILRKNKGRRLLHRAKATIVNEKAGP
jgi:hypothetical protein